MSCRGVWSSNGISSVCHSLSLRVHSDLWKIHYTSFIWVLPLRVAASFTLGYMDYLLVLRGLQMAVVGPPREVLLHRLFPLCDERVGLLVSSASTPIVDLHHATEGAVQTRRCLWKSRGWHTDAWLVVKVSYPRSIRWLWCIWLVDRDVLTVASLRRSNGAKLSSNARTSRLYWNKFRFLCCSNACLRVHILYDCTWALRWGWAFLFSANVSLFK